MTIWDNPEIQYIKIYDFIDFSEELLGVTRADGKTQVINWLKNKEVKLMIYINFKGYALINQAENTPYQYYSQCNYIHAWVKLIPYSRSALMRRFNDKRFNQTTEFLNSDTGFIDKIMTSKHISTKYLPKELEPIEPIELKKSQKVDLGLGKPLSNDFSMMLNETNHTEIVSLYFKKDELLKIIYPSDIEENRSQQILRLSNENENLRFNIYTADKRIVKLESQLTETLLADQPIDSLIPLNTDIQNVKKIAIKQFNRSLASVLIELDYQGKLRKHDIANHIMPYMKELAFVLADEQADKANNLMVTYDTLYDTHLQGLGFKQGRQSNEEKEKVNIDLLFKKQLPITE